MFSHEFVLKIRSHINGDWIAEESIEGQMIEPSFDTDAEWEAYARGYNHGSRTERELMSLQITEALSKFLQTDTGYLIAYSVMQSVDNWKNPMYGWADE